jgi:hypothetical protein
MDQNIDQKNGPKKWTKILTKKMDQKISTKKTNH